MDVMSYVKPELLVLTVVLYFIGVWIKKSETIKDRYIPSILGAIGIALATIWVMGTSTIDSWQSVVIAIFVGIVQGVLIAGLSTYSHQIIKQKNIDE